MADGSWCVGASSQKHLQSSAHWWRPPLCLFLSSQPQLTWCGIDTFLTFYPLPAESTSFHFFVHSFIQSFIHQTLSEHLLCTHPGAVTSFLTRVTLRKRLSLSMEKLIQINDLYSAVASFVFGILVSEHPCGPQPGPFSAPQAALSLCLPELPLWPLSLPLLWLPGPALNTRVGVRPPFWCAERQRPIEAPQKAHSTPLSPNNLPLSSVLAATAGS